MGTVSRAELIAENQRLRQQRDTWELAALAALSRGLDPATAARVGDRMREIVFGKAGGPQADAH